MGVRTRGSNRRGICTRGGSNSSGQKTDASKTQKEQYLETKWKHEDHQPDIPPFTNQPKLNVDMPENADMIDFLDIFLDEEFYNMITIQTNLYASQFRKKHTILPRYSRARNWKDVTNDEMRQFIALQVLTGIVKKPEISQYWSTDPFLRSPIFNEVMPRNRFQSITEFLHFNNNSKYDNHDTTRDRLYKVRPLVEYLVGKFEAAYTPDKHLSIDEQLLLWKGRLGFKQYIPNKRSRFGVKIFSLCELSGYLWNSFVYLGKEAIMSNEEQEYIKKLGKSGAVVPKLPKIYMGKGITCM